MKNNLLVLTILLAITNTIQPAERKISVVAGSEKKRKRSAKDEATSRKAAVLDQAVVEECAICMESKKIIHGDLTESLLSEKAKEVFLACKQHTFHKSCLLTWFERNPSCPVCRAQKEPSKTLEECLAAAAEGNLSHLTHFVAEGGNVNVQDREGNTPLQIAVTLQSLPMVQALLAAPFIDVNPRDKELNSPLHRAVELENLSIVNALLAARTININALNEDNWTPLHVAAINGNTAIALRLIAAGAMVNILNADDRAPMHYAAILGNIALIKQLIRANAASCLKDLHEQIPLHYAAKNGHTEAARLLLANSRIDSLVKNENGKTPADLAEHQALKELILQYQSFR